MKDADEIHVNVTRVVIVMCLTKFTASFCFTVSRGMAGARSGPDPSIPLGREALRYAALAYSIDNNECCFAPSQCSSFDTRVGYLKAFCIEEAMSSLPEKQRVIVELMKIEGYTAKEVAKKLDMSESAVKVSAHRTYKLLKEKLQKTA